MCRQACRSSMMPSFGFGWNDPRGWQVYFGTSASDVELKMRVYELMVSFIDAERHSACVDQCDVPDRTILQDKSVIMEEIVVGIDVGTTKVCTLVGRVEDNKSIRILGVGIEPSEGIRKA